MSNDYIDPIAGWLQFGPDGTTFSTNHGVTLQGTGFTISTTSVRGFLIVTQGTTWLGQFPTSATLWFDGTPPGDSASGTITMVFDTLISGFDHIAAQPNLFGPYTATMQAYDSLDNLLGEGSFSSDSEDNPGSLPQPGLTFTSGSANIKTLVFSVDNDGAGFALGQFSPAVPPSAITTQGQIF